MMHYYTYRPIFLRQYHWICTKHVLHKEDPDQCMRLIEQWLTVLLEYFNIFLQVLAEVIVKPLHFHNL